MLKKMLSEKKVLLTNAFVLLVFVIAAMIPSEMVNSSSPVSAIPIVFLLLMIVITKRFIEAMILAICLGNFMLYKTGLLWPTIDTMWAILLAEDTVWLLLITITVSALTVLIGKSGGMEALYNFVVKRCKSERMINLVTYLSGIVFCIDDYLKLMTVGGSMRRIYEKEGITKKKLFYLNGTTASPLVALVPFSVWGFFIAGQFEANGVGTSGMDAFIHMMPFNFYSWMTLIIGFLFALGIIPCVGKMKQFALEDHGSIETKCEEEAAECTEGEEKPKKARMINFLLPIAVLIGLTVYLDFDGLTASIVTLGFAFVLYLVQGVIKPEDFQESLAEGFGNLSFLLLMIPLGYIFAAVNEQVGFVEFIINNATGIVSPLFLPVIIFVIFAISEFATAQVFGLYILLFPIVIPIATGVGCNPYLAAAAVVSAGVFGAQQAYISDIVILNSTMVGDDPYDCATAQMPYTFAAVVLSAIAFLIAGFVVR